MPTALERAIDDLSDPDVTLPAALRRLLVVSRRIGASDLSTWIVSELNGYAADADVPTYRNGRFLPIMLRFDGGFGTSSSHTVHAAELPKELAAVMDVMDLREPVAELEALASGEGDPDYTLPTQWLAMYRHLAESNQVPHVERMVLNHAGVTTPRTHLLGILDRVKTNALDLALSLEDVSPEVGSSGGPTIESDERLSEKVQVNIAALYATGSTLTIGNDATVATGEGATAIRLETGDVDGLLREASLFLSQESVQELSNALEADGGQPSEATRSFLDRVKSGAAGLALGVTTNGAYAGLVHLIQQVFPS